MLGKLESPFSLLPIDILSAAFKAFYYLAFLFFRLC